MPTALDTFRAQRAATDGVYARLTDVSQLLQQLRDQAEALARNDALLNVLQQEHSWLQQAERTVAEVRHFRELEMRRGRPAVLKRWALALMFALALAAAAGAGYAAITKPYAAELAALRSRAGLADFVEARILAMTPAERRQFDSLMKWKTPQRR